MNLLLQCCLALLPIASALAQSSAKPPAVPQPEHADVRYGQHERHRLDFWQASGGGAARTPLLVFIHGGGWAGGDKADVPAKLLSLMLKQGVSVAAINYRYTSIAIIPAPLHDAARAVQFLRSKAAEWRLDPARIAAYGISAGGCSALWLACHDDLADASSSDPVARESSRLCAAVGMSPQVSLEPAVVTAWAGDQVLAHPMIARAVQAARPEQMKSPRPEWVALLREASPITHVSRDDPPVLVSNPRFDPLPATSPGSAIHHAVFGAKLKERCDAAGMQCLRVIQDEAKPAEPTPESFLLAQLRRKS